jgi:hypothetical protein
MAHIAVVHVAVIHVHRVIHSENNKNNLLKIKQGPVPSNQVSRALCNDTRGINMTRRDGVDMQTMQTAIRAALPSFGLAVPQARPSSAAANSTVQHSHTLF